MEKTLGIDDFLQQQCPFLMGTTDDPPSPVTSNLCLMAVLQHRGMARVWAEDEANHLCFEPIHIKHHVLSGSAYLRRRHTPYWGHQ